MIEREGDESSEATTHLDEVAFQKLATERLEKALQFCFFAPPTPEIGPRGSRQRHVLALEMIRNFLLASGISHKIGLEISHFALALLNLDRGIVSSVFRPSEVSNRPVDPGGRWLGRAYVAMAVDALVESGIAPSARAAARIINEKRGNTLAPLLSKGSRFQGVVQKWYSELNAGNAKNSFAQSIYNDRKRHADICRDRLRETGEGAEVVDIVNHFLWAAEREGERANGAEEQAPVV